MLTGNEIERQIKIGNIVIDPYNDKQLNPNSYNITLHNELLMYSNKILDIAKENPTKIIKIPSDGLALLPGRLYLGRTVEYTETYGLIPCIDGRSSIARYGINVHHTGGFGDIGFKGTWTLEISCVQPVIIYPFIEIGQIYYFKPEGIINKIYDGRYQGQIDATASRFNL